MFTSSVVIIPLIEGLVCLVLFMLAARFFERTWFPPALLFELAFLCGALLGPSLTTDKTLDRFNLALALSFSVNANVCFLAGYVLYNWLKVRRPRQIPRLEPLFNRTQRAVARLALYASIAFYTFAVIAGGGLVQGKGASAYQVGGLIWRLGMAAQAMYGLGLAVLITCFEPGNRRADKRAVICLMGLMLLISVATFERGNTAKLILYFAIFYHYRVRRLGMKTAMAVMAGILIITVAAYGRTQRTGILSAGVGETAGVIAHSVEENPAGPLIAIASSLSGEEIFTQVISIIPTMEDYTYGRTYVQSLVGCLLPRTFMPEIGEVNTPAYWFQRVYAPNLRGNGLDFSMLAEAYMNFGSWLGLVFFVVGILMAWISWTIRTSSSSLMVLFCILTLVSFSFGLRSDSNTVLKMVFYYPLPVFLILGLFRKMPVRSAQPIRGAFAPATVAPNGSYGPPAGATLARGVRPQRSRN